jgi:hypothetical protein
MKKYFNTKEKAIKHLEYRTQRAYTRIEKRGDKILRDASFIYQNTAGKWVVFMQIFTQQMIKDLEEIQGMFDSITPLFPFTPAEKIMKSEKRLKKVERKYKTLDVENYTINKEV